MEEIFIPLIVFSFVLILVKMSLDYKREKAQFRYGGTAEDKGVRTSELRQMIKEALREVNAPLEVRMDEIEAHLARMEQQALPPAREKAVLGEPPHGRAEPSVPAPGSRIS